MINQGRRVSIILELTEAVSEERWDENLANLAKTFPVPMLPFRLIKIGEPGR